MIERVADALESAELSWRMELTRLVDGEGTYTLFITGEPPREFSETDDLYDYVGKRKRSAAAHAAIKALREPIEAMHNAARDWSKEKYGKPIGIDASTGCWRAMIDAAIASE